MQSREKAMTDKTHPSKERSGYTTTQWEGKRRKLQCETNTTFKLYKCLIFHQSILTMTKSTLVIHANYFMVSIFKKICLDKEYCAM